MTDPWQSLSGPWQPALGAWQPRATLRASIAEGPRNRLRTCPTVHGSTIAAGVVHPVVQSRFRSDTPSMRPRPPQGNPGTGVREPCTTAVQPRQGRTREPRRQPTTPPNGRAWTSPRGPRHGAVRTAPAPLGPELAGGQGPVTGDRDWLLGDCCRSRADDSPDCHCVLNKTARTTLMPEAIPHLNLRPPRRTTPPTRMAERQPLKPRSWHTFVSALRVILPLAWRRVPRAGWAAGEQCVQASDAGDVEHGGPPADGGSRLDQTPA